MNRYCCTGVVLSVQQYTHSSHVHMNMFADITQQLHSIVLILNLFLCNREGGAVDRVEGVLGQHGCQELLVMLLLFLKAFALGLHLQAEGDRKPSGS